MPPKGFEPTISAGEWPQTYALDRAATGTGTECLDGERKNMQNPRMNINPTKIETTVHCTPTLR